ncbi:hypothetical protein GCM10018773_37110 [Streptomyces candidus]|nr:hypothetical protein GCM10018773_37110 [Streptomyces candidus]
MGGTLDPPGPAPARPVPPAVVSARPAPARPRPHRPTSQRAPGPGRLSWGPARNSHLAHRKEHLVLEAFFSALLVLVCVGVLAFTALAVKKLYQGQR